jgi:hypothetical protein
MGAIIDAGARFAARAAARKPEKLTGAALERAEEEAQRAEERRWLAECREWAAWQRERWLADLETWPRAFREALRPLVLRMDAEGYIFAGPADEFPWHINVPQLRRLGGWKGALFSYKAGMIQVVREYAQSAQRLGRGAQGTRVWLLLMLWATGVRRIDRRGEELADEARKHGEGRRSEEPLAHTVKTIVRLEARIARGTAEQTGKPYSASQMKGWHTKLAEAQVQAARLRRQIAEESTEWALANPLKVALGCIPKRHRVTT